MTETVEEKLARFETVIGLQMQEIDRLRSENERLRTVAGAHGVLKEIYLDPDAPQGNRIKAATAALPHETPRLEPQPAPLELTAAEYEPLSTVVERQRRRCDALLALPLEERAALIRGVGRDDGSDDSGD